MNYLELYRDAIVRNSVDKLRESIASGLVDLDGEDDDGNNYLCLAVKEKKVEILKLLLPHLSCREINRRRSKDGLTALEIAVKSNQLEAAKLLLEHGADVNSEYYRNSLWDLALENADVDMIKLIMSHGGLGHIGCVSCILRSKSVMSNPELRDDFVEYGADVFFKDSHGRDALCDALFHAELEYVEQLLKMGLSAKQVDDEGMTPLHRLLCDGRQLSGDEVAARIRLLVDHGADVNAIHNSVLTPDENFTPLYYAAAHASPKPSECLLKLGAKIDRGVSPLARAIDYVHNFDTLEFLIEKGASVDYLEDENTLLDIAIFRLNSFRRYQIKPMYMQMMQLLVERGVKHNDHKNPWVKATKPHRRKLETYLSERERMRVTEVCSDSPVTYLDLLLKRRDALTSCLRNVNVCENLGTSARRKQLFPAFSERLETNLSRGFERIPLFEDALDVLAGIFTRLPTLPNEVIEKIVGYLDNEELVKITALKIR